MSKSRLGPEARIITLFAALSEDSKRIVLDVIKSQATTPRKMAAKKPSASPLAQKEPAADKEAKCGTCGNVKDHPDHDRGYIKSHDFEPPKSVARAPRRSSKKPEETSSIPSSETSSEDVGNAALAASGGSSGD
jgi:hypothetical protein